MRIFYSPDAMGAAVATPPAKVEPVVPAAVVPAVPVPVPAAVPSPAAEPAKVEAAPWSAPAKKPDAAVAAIPPKADDKTPEPVKVPAPFALKAPEGATIDPAVLEGYKVLSEKLGLTSEQAQKVYDGDLERVKEYHAAKVKQDQTWLGELRTEWGPKFQERSITVGRAYDYADPDGSLRKILAQEGYLNHPALTKFVERFGDLFKEDKISSGATGVPKEKDTRPQQERLREAFEREARELEKKKK